MDFIKTLKQLTEAPPHQVVELVEAQLKKYAKTSRSPLGNLYGEIAGTTAKTLLLDAHLDEISLLVVGIDANGFVLVDRCGGVDPRTLQGTRVTVWGDQPIDGVFSITPPHLQRDNGEKLPPITQMAIDVGMSRERATTFIRPGHTVTFHTPLTLLADSCVSAKGLDNRAGVAILLRVCELLRDKPPAYHVVMQFSQMEEAGTGYAGGVTGAQTWQPDRAIVVDAGFAAYPGMNYATPGELSQGPMIGVAPLLSREMSNRLVALAEGQSIPFTLDVTGKPTGTNADRITAVGRGIPTALISYPLQNMHMPTEVVDVQDLEHTAQLLVAYLTQGGEAVD